jgi:hypothetical protein
MLTIACFDLWMSKGAYNIFALVINVLLDVQLLESLTGHTSFLSQAGWLAIYVKDK